MTRTGTFLSTVAAVFSHSGGSLTAPTVPASIPTSMSTASLDRVASRPSTSYSIASSKPATSQSKGSKKWKKSRSKKIKQHNEVWWTLTTPYKGEFREFLPNGQVSHEWNHMYL
jgi:hypothetical protein